MKNRTYEELDVPYFTDRTRASLKIQEGCNNFLYVLYYSMGTWFNAL